jgi:SAM-dependent methyltransferase
VGAAGERWRADLESWAVPPEILASAARSPWGHDVRRFAARAAQVLDDATPTPSTAAAAESLVPLAGEGTVLDVGAGAGASSLPLLPYARALTAVDPSEEMLEALAVGAARLGRGRDVRAVVGRWPDVAADVGADDVVVSQHVLYDVPDVVPFLAALTTAARARVVLELTVRHPMSWLNPLWLRVHGLVRPERPTVDDLVAVLGELHVHGLAVVRWSTPDPDLDTTEQLVERVTRRLCLPPDREPEIAALLEADPPSDERRLATISWDGTAS